MMFPHSVRRKNIAEKRPNNHPRYRHPIRPIRVTSLMRAGQTFQQATQVQTLRLCPNQGWPRHRPDKLANTQQNPAFAKLSMDRCTQAWADGARWNNDVLHCSAECLLLAQSGHHGRADPCPLLGVKRTSVLAMRISVPDPKQTLSTYATRSTRAA